MNRTVIFPYKMGSASAKSLADSCNMLRVRANGNYRARRSDLVINWGNSVVPPWVGEAIVLNSFEAVATASDKLASFRAFSSAGVSCPPFTTDKEEAQQWAETSAVVGRELLRASSGRGITLYPVGADLTGAPRTPLWTKYIKKRSEYRVHVFQGEVIRVQEKRRQIGFEGRNNQIRNHGNGWVFCTENVVIDSRLSDLAISSVSSLGLDFGAVDAIYNQHTDTYYTLEVNTAPGIEGGTLDAYVNAVNMLRSGS